MDGDEDETEEEVEVDVTIEIQFEEETTITEETTTPLEEMTKNTGKFYIIILCLIPLTLLTAMLIIMARKHFG